LNLYTNYLTEILLVQSKAIPIQSGSLAGWKVCLVAGRKKGWDQILKVEPESFILPEEFVCVQLVGSRRL
jgi:hypothetical protein